MYKHTKKQKTETRKQASITYWEAHAFTLPDTVDWNKAIVDKYYRPVKKQITLRLDADTLEWFKTQDGKYQTRINQVLRRYMEFHRSDK